MTAHTRAARRERQAASLLGTTRIHRSRYESAPDVAPVTLPCGVVLSCEVKTRKRLPALLVAALAQAKRYAPEAVPTAVVSATGGEPLIVLPLRAFRRIAGLDALPVPPAVLGTDEFRVLEAIAARLRLGRDVYGALDVDGDPRDWLREASEEALDLAVYLAAALLRGVATGKVSQSATVA